MPHFLTQAEIYRMLQRELPEGVYPDGAPSAFYSTASVDAKAKVLASLYGNAERIYDNYFPQTADERIEAWELKVFGELQDEALGLAERRTRVIQKLRKRPSLALWEILTIVASYLPEGTFVQVVPWCHGDGGPWILGESLLGVNTNLAHGDPAIITETGDDICGAVVGTGWRLGSSSLGEDTYLGDSYSWQVISAVQARAYTYEVRIFDYELVGTEYARMIKAITAAEPARSAHVIQQNLSLADYGLIFPVSDVGQFDGVDCITRDSGSTTGYNGMEHV